MKTWEYYDLNYCCTIKEEHPGKIGKLLNDSKFYKIYRHILRLFFNVFKQFFFRKKKSSFPTEIETVFVICTFNQLKSLEGLINNIENSLVISTFPIESENNLIVDFVGNSFYSLMCFPKLFFEILKESGFKRKAMIYHFYEFLNSPGVYDQAYKYIKAINPKSVILANDHTFFPRSYFRAAQKLKVKTIYTQHASVSAYFPELEFDYVFLDGQETFDKYILNGRKYSSKVFLSGSPRFDKIVSMKKNNYVDLGIAINILDDRENVVNFVESLASTELKLAIRPHPALNDKLFWKEYCHVNSIVYSDPLCETPVNFISNCREFVAGDSAFHLEVALSGKISYYYNFQNEPTTDWYQYIANGLINVKRIDEILNLLNDGGTNQVHNSKVKYYVANFDTKYWGNALELLKLTIEEINSEKSFSLWEEVNGEIFEIKK